MDAGLSFDRAEPRPSLRGRSIFLSASIPDPARWEGRADPLEITDAVVALARVCLSAGMRLITAAHPTIAPLLSYVAAELPSELEAQVAIYQSMLFEDVLPPATRRFETEGVAQVIWTEAVEGDRPEPGHWDPSLAVMRNQMLSETEPSAAVFIGGMEGIQVEYELFQGLCAGRPAYPIAYPGGEAELIAREMSDPPVPDLLDGRVYPTVWRRVLDDIEAGLRA